MATPLEQIVSILSQHGEEGRIPANTLLQVMSGPEDNPLKIERIYEHLEQYFPDHNERGHAAFLDDQRYDAIVSKLEDLLDIEDAAFRGGGQK